jgi:hypothetical protein
MIGTMRLWMGLGAFVLIGSVVILCWGVYHGLTSL